MNFDFKKIHNFDHTKYDILEIIGDISKIESLSGLENAQERDLVYMNSNIVSGDKYVSQSQDLKSKYIITTKEIYETLSNDFNNERTFLISKNPRISFFKIAKETFVENNIQQPFFNHSQHKTGSNIHSQVQIHNNTMLGSNVTIQKNVIIETGCIIGNNAIIHSGTKIGKNTIIEDNVVIGKNGFGFEFDKQQMQYYSIPHFGNVIIGENVYIGANTCIDRGVLNNTIIGNSVKIDNLVQIAHGVQIDDYTCIAGQVGIAGSARIGKFCMIGGKVGIVGHIKIGDKVIIQGYSLVTKSVPSNTTISSAVPACDIQDWHRKMAKLNILSKK